MFDLLAPGNLVLTLQSKPPFVLESAFAVALTVLLAAPLIARVYLLLDEPLKNFAKRPAPSCRRRGRSSESLVIRYPAREVVDITSSSDLRLGAARRTNSTSAVRGDGGVSRSSSGQQVEDDDVAKKIEARESRRRKRPSLSRLPSSIAAACWPVDISGLNYKAHRHRLIEASLRQQYDDYQPPGDVVLNSLHLNSADSVVGVRLNDHSLFDFVEKYYDATKATSRENAGRQPHLLDHFLVKGARRPKTAERQTETQPEDDVDRESFGCESVIRDYLPVNADGVSSKSPSVDTNGNPRVQPPPPPPPPQTASIEQKVVVERNDLDSTSTRPRVRAFRETRESSLKEDRRKSSWTTKNRSASAGSTSTLQAPRALSRVATLPESKRLLRSSGRRRSAGRFGGSAKKLEEQPGKPLPQSPSSSYERTSGGHQEEATANFFPRSSSEIISVCSEHSADKYRDETSCRSRESSISPKSRARPPWLSGDRGSSFNRKYTNIAKDSARTGRPVSARGSSLPRKSALPSGGRSSKPISRDPTLPGLRTNVIASREKKRIRVPAEEKEEKETEEEKKEREQDVIATSPCRQEDHLKEEVGRSLVTPGNNEIVRIPQASDLPDGGIPEPATSRFPRDNTASFSSSRARTYTGRKPQASSDASASATSAATPRIRTTWGPRSARLVPDPGRKQPARNTRDTGEGSKPPLVQDGRTSVARLNRGGGRRAANAAPAKAAPLDSKIELPGQVLNSADNAGDERGGSPPTDSAELGERAPQVAPPRENVERTTGGDRADAQEIPSVKNASGETRAENNAGSDNSSRVARPRVPVTTRNLRQRPASVDHNLAESRRAAPRGASTARKSADSETAGGLSGAKLNGRLNDALGRVKRDEPPAGSARRELRQHPCAVDGAKAREKCNGATGTASDEEELRLPRHDSKVGLAMNSALRRYIETLRQGLLDRSDRHGVALATLSLTDAISILSGEKAPLSAEETRELQSVLSRVERNPELLLLRKASPSSADNTA